MKCSYCINDSTYSFGWIDCDGKSHDSYSCDEHKELAYLRQRMALKRDEEKTMMEEQKIINRLYNQCLDSVARSSNLIYDQKH